MQTRACVLRVALVQALFKPIIFTKNPFRLVKNEIKSNKLHDLNRDENLMTKLKLLRSKKEWLKEEFFVFFKKQKLL